VTRRSDGTMATFPPPPDGPVFRPRGVLVIDDTEVVRSVLEIGLGASGFAVWLASSGREGVALYLVHRTAIDIVLLDVRMPGWDGPATLAAIRALDPDVACCFMSADTGEYTEEQLMGLGAAALIQKPFRLGELLGQLARLGAPSEPHEERWVGGSGWG
jgi:two-component system, OmpR family, response regulator